MKRKGVIRIVFCVFYLISCLYVYINFDSEDSLWRLGTGKFGLSKEIIRFLYHSIGRIGTLILNIIISIAILVLPKINKS